MTAKKSQSSRPKINEWDMDSYISNEVSFRKGLGDYHSIVISRFPSEVTLAEFGKLPNRERHNIYGLTIVNSSRNTSVMVVPRNRLVVADARFSLDYSDDCGPVALFDGYFSRGNLVSILGENDKLKPHTNDRSIMTEFDDNKSMIKIFQGVLKYYLEGHKDYSFGKLQDLVRNSNLPYHYKDAVKSLL